MVAFRHDKEFVKCKGCGHEFERSAKKKVRKVYCDRCNYLRNKK
jgi:hypothetical protein